MNICILHITHKLYLREFFKVSKLLIKYTNLKNMKNETFNLKIYFVKI